MMWLSCHQLCVRASVVADKWQVMPVVNLPAAQSESGGCVVVQAGINKCRFGRVQNGYFMREKTILLLITGIYLPEFSDSLHHYDRTNICVICIKFCSSLMLAK